MIDFKATFLSCVCVAMTILTGCSTTPPAPPPPSENLVVPPLTDALGVLRLKRVYALQRSTAMNAIAPGTAQPEIHLTYNPATDGPPPAEALERVAVQPSGTVTEEMTETDTDPNTGQTTTTTTYIDVSVDASWGQHMLPTGTRLAVTSVEVYENSHVYRGRILDGPAHNCFVLFVVPNGNATMPTLAELQTQDVAYLAPVSSPPTTKPMN